ncbi:MAG: tetratricopeptide repeat protein, partial [Planctomycetota bacterium]
DIANQVIDRLGITVAAAEREAIGARPTDNLEAYQLYQRAQHFHNKRNEEANRKALECYKEAVDLDDRFALALYGMARVWAFREWYCHSAPEDVYSESHKWLAKAFEIDPELPEYWAMQAILCANHNLDFAKSETAFQNAIRFARKYSRFPKGYPTAHHWYGGTLSAQGRHDEALKQGLEAQRLDPVSPIITTWVGLRHYFAGRYRKAIQEIDKALYMDQEFAPGHWHQSWALAQVDRYPDAITAAKKAFAISANPLYTTALAWAQALNGERDEARRLLAELDELQKTRYVSDYHLATVHVALGEKDKAFQRLEKAHRLRDGWRQYLKVDPRLIPLHDDPRFALLAKRMGL